MGCQRTARIQDPGKTWRSFPGGSKLNYGQGQSFTEGARTLLMLQGFGLQLV